jgi:hypothetical protein
MAVAFAPAYIPGSWNTFFTLTGTAAATLTGLFFVAFSLRQRDLQLSRVIRTRARYLLLWLIVITVSSAFVVMPGQSVPRWPLRSSSCRRAAPLTRSGLCFGRLGGSDLRSQPIWPGGGSAWW